MFVTRIISDGGLKATEGSFSLDIRLPWYRSLPLSTISVAALTVDGEPFPLTAIGFQVNGKTYTLNELCLHSEEWWFVLDSAFLLIRGMTPAHGTQHIVSVTVGIKPPYIPGFYRLTECTKQLLVQQTFEEKVNVECNRSASRQHVVQFYQ